MRVFVCVYVIRVLMCVGSVQPTHHALIRYLSVESVYLSNQCAHKRDGGCDFEVDALMCENPKERFSTPLNTFNICLRVCRLSYSAKVV